MAITAQLARLTRLNRGRRSQPGEAALVADRARQDALSVFEQQAAAYDAWYDQPLGRAVFVEELHALRPLVEDAVHAWLEVGVGTGRFAQALGVETGLDPAGPALRLARQRGVDVVQGRAEALPFIAPSFGAVLLVLTLCFVADPVCVLKEACRVLKPGGIVVLGLVLAEGPWGRHYRRLADRGHPVYRHAHFFTRGELDTALARAQLVPRGWRSALLWPPTGHPSVAESREGYDPAAGFTVLRATAAK